MLTIPAINKIISNALTMTDAVYTSAARFESDIAWLHGLAAGTDERIAIGATEQVYLEGVVGAVRDDDNALALALADQGMMPVAGQMVLAKALGFRRASR